MTSRRLGLGLCLALSLSIAAGPTTAAGAADAGARGRLPEDPVAGAKSTRQWREFMVAEEHERRLRYDRNHLKEHRGVLKVLVATRARYDRAKTKAAVAAAQKRLPPTIDDVRARIKRIDHWGNNSNLHEDYDAMLKALSDAYPAARIASLDGDRAPLDAARAEFDRRLKHAQDWLAEAKDARDE